MTVETHSPRSAVRILIFLALVAAIIAVMFVAGWADDHAPPGSKGRVPVTAASDS
jgi:hypothetical protein